MAKLNFLNLINAWIKDENNSDIDISKRRIFGLFIGRLGIEIFKPFSWGYFNNEILDVCGYSFGWLVIGWWYDDIPEGQK